jgi:hypothetical protein
VADDAERFTKPGEGFPPGFEYLWVPEVKAGGRKPTPQKCSAPQYVDYVMTWVEDQINNEEVGENERGVGVAETKLTSSPPCHRFSPPLRKELIPRNSRRWSQPSLSASFGCLLLCIAVTLTLLSNWGLQLISTHHSRCGASLI